MKKRLLLITTGGTIDGADLDTRIYREKSSLQEMVEQKTNFIVETVHAFNKDSREITNEDRDIIIGIIQKKNASCVLIGHGTYTICETGAYLKKKLQQDRRTILLIGSWIPLGEASSDAPKQIQDALGVLEQNPFGIYVAMNGKLWNPDTTRKIKKADGTLDFESSEMPLNIKSKS
jgi:L-asparaginase